MELRERPTRVFTCGRRRMMLDTVGPLWLPVEVPIGGVQITLSPLFTQRIHSTQPGSALFSGTNGDEKILCKQFIHTRPGVWFPRGKADKSDGSELAVGKARCYLEALQGRKIQPEAPGKDCAAEVESCAT